VLPQVPTTVFTPIEYGCVGLSEEAAIATFGEENVETFLSTFTPLEWKIPEERSHDTVLAKVGGWVLRDRSVAVADACRVPRVVHCAARVQQARGPACGGLPLRRSERWRGDARCVHARGCGCAVVALPRC
jgi:hypothetical protein